MDEKDVGKVEEILIKEHFKKSETQFADKVQSLLRALSVEKQEDEKNQIFHERLLSELKTILNF